MLLSKTYIMIVWCMELFRGYASKAWPVLFYFLTFLKYSPANQNIQQQQQKSSILIGRRLPTPLCYTRVGWNLDFSLFLTITHTI